MDKEDREMYVSVFERVYTEKGKEEGRTEERTEIARNMLNKGFSAKEIQECTRMPREELDMLMDGKGSAF
jgi:predicted transposase/invertase (TIGR01784 family)